METCIVRGGKRIDGEVFISGSKNAALCLIAASLLTRKKTIFYRIPHLLDVDNFLEILKEINVIYEFKDNVLSIDSSNIQYHSLILDKVHKFRASYYLIGGLLYHFKHLEIAYPGGCSFEKRPIDIHLQFFRDIGIEVQEEKDYLIFDVKEEKEGIFTLKNISFGATVNAILYAVSLKKDIFIKNVSPECEIDYLISYLNQAGAHIEKEKEGIFIKGSSAFHDVTFTNMFDRMELGTFAFLGAGLGSIRLKGVDKMYLTAIEKALYMSGASYYYIEDTLVVRKPKEKHSVILETGVYPLFPTDLQPILTAYLLTIPRIHVIKENIYQDRFSHVDELKKMGAMISKEKDTLLINGIFALRGTRVEAKDLRCGASLLLASFFTLGESEILHAEILKRGYENLYEKLHLLNLDIGVKKC